MIQSAEFWCLLGVSVVVFWLLPQRFRVAFLAMVSVGYVASQHWQWAVALLGWTALFYWLAPIAASARKSAQVRAQRRQEATTAGGDDRGGSGTVALVTAPTEIRLQPRRWILPMLILGIVGYLAWFKYLQNLPEIQSILGQSRGARPIKLAIPLGISYFTFKFIHYAIEVTRGNIKDRSPWQFLSYIFLFPTFSAGPIEQFDHYLANQEQRFSLGSIVAGLTRISHGLIKKLIVADAILGAQITAIMDHNFMYRTRDASALDFWGYAIAMYMWVYMDFSGYSDIAIGASRLFGLRIMENFNFPIVAANINDFWRRWHMTLAGWCQKYIYMPVLGWFRNPYLALYSTFIVIALWHAASSAYLFWGCYHATGIAIYQLWAKFKRRQKWKSLDRWPWKYAGIPLTFLFVSAGEICTLGGAQTGHEAFRILGRLLFMHVRTTRG
jgi:alginate O-acetyltransferase complex protein AlgI